MSTPLPRTMTALKKISAAPGLTHVEGVEVPKVGPRDVLIAVTHAGICGTDRHIYEWDAWSAARIPVGITTGHEFVGRVAAVGDAVTRTRVGERVSAEGHIGCGVCRPCRTGNAHICDKVDIIGIDRDGCFAQFVSVPEENVWPVHADIPDHVAAIFDPLGNAMHTVMAANVSGKTVLITGVGIIGLMAVSIARHAGATRILVSDIDPRRLKLARELGADEAYVATDESWPEKAREATGGLGPQVLLEMSGNARAISQGFKALANGGTAALLGIPARPVSFNLADEIIFKGATVLGINGRRMYETWYQVEDYVRSGRFPADKIITHQLPLDDFNEGFKLMQSGDAIKVVLRVPAPEKTSCPVQRSTSAPVSSSIRSATAASSSVSAT
ncbi:MAG TPA: L-threonine 3-dehydrogenase [Planctomycetota bacterium]|nr:L-threonine 3-dehydrogenase [Planctomycetota bacterium]